MLMSGRIYKLCPLCLFCFLFAFASPGGERAWAQSATASLSGLVLDENQAVITGVNITALNLNTTVQRRAVTDGNGCSLIPLLSPGQYHLVAERDGCTPREIRDLRLASSEPLALRVRLKASGIGENAQILEASP